jgi:CheY-like chemotaxis protein
MQGVVTSRRVLIVDDFKDITDTLIELVTMLGHTAIGATHGDRALQMVREFRPDLVLLDLAMPDPDGYEVARRLRAEANGHALEIVAMSGLGHRHAREQAIQAGFDRHFVKPLTLAHLRALLATPTRTPMRTSLTLLR